MILNHLWGLYTHPKEEWHAIDKRNESYFYSLSHIAIISLIPVLMSYYSAAHLGWYIQQTLPGHLSSMLWNGSCFSQRHS